jgi:hypothetical protein
MAEPLAPPPPAEPLVVPTYGAEEPSAPPPPSALSMDIETAGGPLAVKPTVLIAGHRITAGRAQIIAGVAGVALVYVRPPA